MALDSVGYYALPIIPTFKGIERGISSKIKTTFGKTGTEAGKLMGDNVAKGLASAKGKVDSAAAKHAKSLDKVETAAGQARVEIQKLNEAINKGVGGSRLTQQTERTAAALRKEAAAAREAKTAETQLQNARRTLSSQQAAGGGPAAGLSQSVEQGGSGAVPIMGKVGGKAGAAFMAGLGAVVSVAAVGALLKSALDTGIDFERSVNMFGGVTASGAEGMERMREQARALGGDTQLAGVSARDAGNAMVELAKGGMSAEQAMEAARGTLQLATAGQLDAAEAAKYQSAVLNTWQLDASNATRVADLLAAGANASAADVSDLGQAMQQGGAVAAGFGVSVEDSITALTLFSKWGINGSDAGTMLKTSLQAITDQGNPAQGAIEQLGLKLYDAHGQFVGVESMMKQVGEASKRMTQEQFQAATAVLFGSDAMRASMVAANGGADAWDATAEAVTRQGAAADMASAQMRGLPGIVESLSNVWEGFKLKLFDVIDGPLIAIGDWFVKFLSGEGGVGGAGEVLGSLGDTFKGIGEVVGQYLMPALKQLWENIKGPLIEYGKQWVDTFKSAMPILKAVGVVIGAALLGAIKGLSITLPILIKGMTAVITVAKGIYTGIAALAGVVMTVGKAIGGAFVGAWNLLKAAVGAAWSVIKPVVDGFKAALGFLGDAGRYAFETVIIPMWHNVQTVAGAAWSVIRPIFEAMGSAWRAVADAAVQFWQGSIVPVWEGIKGAFSAGWAAISGVFDQLKGGFQGVKDFVSTVWSGLAGVVKGALDGVINAVKGPLRWIGGVLSGVPTSIGPMEIPGAQAARDLGAKLQGLRAGTDSRGVLFGPGTGTSDSILGIDAKTGTPTAFVSAGEGVVRENAMRKGGGVVVEALNKGWVPSPDYLRSMLPGAAEGLNPGADYLRSQIMKLWPQIKTIGGKRADPLPEHPSGNAIDIMIPGWDTPEGKALGDEVAAFISENAEALGLTHFIWQQRLFKPGDTTGSMMGDRGGPTANHYDHVHAWLQAGGGKLPSSPLKMPTGAAAGLSAGMGGYDMSVPAGSTAGTDEQGRQGYFTPESPQRIAELEAKVAEREARVREVEAKGDKASESERLRAERLRDEAKADLEEAKRGKFTEFKESDTGAGTGGAESTEPQLSELGGIAKQFLSDTFGFGELIPDPAELGIVKLASALMGIKYTPQGKGFPWQTGYEGGGGMPWAGNPFVAPGASATGSATDALGGLIPGVNIPPMPEGDQHMPDNAKPGVPVPAGPVDQSTNITIQNPQGDERSIAERTRRVLLNTPRLGTYSAPAAGGPK